MFDDGGTGMELTAVSLVSVFLLELSTGFLYYDMSTL
jgi:hypothetical protein